MTEEVSCTCPYCWQTITIVVDCSVKEQRYTEDCEVCCRPIDFRVRCRKGRTVELEAEAQAW